MQIFNSLFNNLLFSKKYWLVRHTLFWLIMYTDEVLAFTGLVQKEFDFKFFSFQIITDLVLVYSNLYFLIPKFLNRKRLGTYIGGTSVLIMLALIGNYFIIINYLPASVDMIVTLFRSFLLTMGIVGTAIAIKIIKKSLNSQQRLRELEKLNYETEVNYLKMQLNPHFLFNTLNNIYVQSKKYPAAVSESIMKLSDLMRYQIYNGSQRTATLEEEMQFITHYLDLEKMRKDNMQVQTNFSLTQPQLAVSPLLFIPLVENAIKHSYCDSKDVMCIKLYCHTHDGEVIFDIENHRGPQRNTRQGIGLKNLKRRLEILYPEKHTLDIIETDKKYQVTLRINTND